MTFPAQTLVLPLFLGWISTAGLANAAPEPATPQIDLTEDGSVLEKKYSALLDDLKNEFARSLPKVNPATRKAYEQACSAVDQAAMLAGEAQKQLDALGAAKGLVDHARGKWIGGAEKGITAARDALEKATTDAQREAARAELAKWEQNKQDGLAALAARQANYDRLKVREGELRAASEQAGRNLTAARDTQRKAATAIIAELSDVLDTDRFDAGLAECVILTTATPRRLAAFAQEDPSNAAEIDKLLGNGPLMIEMLAAGGAKFDEYGRALEILNAIFQASPKAAEGVLQRLALATSLEHARPIRANLPASRQGQPAFIDPVKRYLHYEKAFLAGELDPAFKTLSTWELRMAVNCDSPDDILTWGREMLRSYRPDHIYNPDYGWRYISAVRTEVPYGSQNVKLDDPALQQHQNIIMNGGVCGRRAFFGRFILRAFGIPTWGVTQRAHAAVSHWTPDGWVVNLGAGYPASWWDKDEVPMSGSQFLIETQARAHESDFRRVLRARWVSTILGEDAFNDRLKTAGGLWSGVAHLQATMLAERSIALDPLGQELAEANERGQKLHSAPITAAERVQRSNPDGSIVIPAVAHGKASGKVSAMRSYGGGMQIHCLGGFTAPWSIDVPRAGKYLLTATVATVQKGQIFRISANDAAATESPVPYTLGSWQRSTPVQLDLPAGANIIHLGLKEGSRGVTIKEIILTPAP